MEMLQNGMVTERNDYKTEKNGNVTERKGYRTEKNGMVAERKRTERFTERKITERL